MEMKDLKPGLYVIRENVKNPKPDRRRNTFQDSPVWTLGTRVAVRAHYTGAPDCIYVFGDYSSNEVTHNHPGWAALVAALEPAPTNALEQMLFDEGYEREWMCSSWYEVLRLMHRDGKLDVPTLREYMERWLKA